MGSRKIVVGIDGSTYARRAMHWAADEARRRSCELVLAHSSALSFAPADSSTSPADIQRAGPADRAIVLESQADAASYGYDIDIRVDMRDVPPVELLVGLGKESELVVLGTHGIGWRPGALIGSISHRVSAHACCPVVLVGHSSADDPRRADVVVGLSSAARGRTAVAFAFAEAAMRSVRLRVVHSWADIDASESVAWFLYRTGAEFRYEQEQAALQALMPLINAFPQVDVDVAVTGDSIRDRLAAESETAGLLVVGCRYPDGGWRSRLGMTSTRVLQNAACPVAVVGHPADVQSPQSVQAIAATS